MRVLLLQTDIKWQSLELNRKRAFEMINDASQADLVILPEMFASGFCVKPHGVAEKADSDTLKWMQGIALNKKVAIAGSVAVEDNGHYFNRFYFVKPDGSYDSYDKRHLFSFGGEDKEYTAGEERVVIEYNGFRILLQICYDLRFPVFARNRNDYDMIIYVANWPVTRIEVWKTLIRARAIENLCYVAAVNRVGNDPFCAYNGETILINYLGQTIVAAETDKEDSVVGEIDLESLTKFREKFPAMRDADQFTLKINGK